MTYCTKSIQCFSIEIFRWYGILLVNSTRKKRVSEVLQYSITRLLITIVNCNTINIICLPLLPHLQPWVQYSQFSLHTYSYIRCWYSNFLSIHISSCNGSLLISTGHFYDPDPFWSLNLWPPSSTFTHAATSFINHHSYCIFTCCLFFFFLTSILFLILNFFIANYSYYRNNR